MCLASEKPVTRTFSVYVPYEPQSGQRSGLPLSCRMLAEMMAGWFLPFGSALWELVTETVNGVTRRSIEQINP